MHFRPKRPAVSERYCSGCCRRDTEGRGWNGGSPIVPERLENAWTIRKILCSWFQGCADNMQRCGTFEAGLWGASGEHGLTERPHHYTDYVTCFLAFQRCSGNYIGEGAASRSTVSGKFAGTLQAVGLCSCRSIGIR